MGLNPMFRPLAKSLLARCNIAVAPGDRRNSSSNVNTKHMGLQRYPRMQPQDPIPRFLLQQMLRRSRALKLSPRILTDPIKGMRSSVPKPEEHFLLCSRPEAERRAMMLKLFQEMYFVRVIYRGKSFDNDCIRELVYGVIGESRNRSVHLVPVHSDTSWAPAFLSGTGRIQFRFNSNPAITTVVRGAGRVMRGVNISQDALASLLAPSGKERGPARWVLPAPEYIFILIGRGALKLRGRDSGVARTCTLLFRSFQSTATVVCVAVGRGSALIALKPTPQLAGNVGTTSNNAGAEILISRSIFNAGGSRPVSTLRISHVWSQSPTGFSMHCHEINMPVVHITLTRLVQQRPRTGDCRGWISVFLGAGLPKSSNSRLRAMHDHLKGPDHRQYHSDGTAYYPTEWECNKFTAMVEQVEHRPAALKVMALTMSPHIPADSRHNRARPGDWQHPAELDYIGPDHPSAQMWNDYSIITYMVSNTVTVPKRTDNRSDPWVTVTTPNEGTATLPRGYRIPLLWLTKVQWETTKVLLTHARPLWDHIKWDVLHLARLTAQFLGKARSEARMKRQWRDATFDRVLHRFFNGWMGCRETFVSHFYDEFKDDEYKDDALARRWAQKVPKGIQGFSCTEEEIVDGIGPETLHAGLKIDRLDATFEWIPDPDEDEIVVDPVVEPAPAPAAPLAAPAAAQPVVQPRTEPAPANASQQETAATGSSQSRGSSPLTSDLGSDIDMIAQSLNPTESTASTSTHRPLTQIVIPSAPTTTTTSAPPRKKSHKPKPRLPATERDSFSGAAPRPL
ncbi:hypothetical protein C8R46DRAFT_1186860, partial [Mycena filopes]